MRSRQVRFLMLAMLGGTAVLAHARTIHVLDATNQPIPDAVIYAEAALPAGAMPHSPPAEAVMAQQDKRFVPHVLAVHTGTPVRFTNHDPINHHVYSFSAAKQFSMQIRKQDTNAPTVMFDHPGIVVLGCNIHDWMLGYIVVLDAAVFASTNANGDAEFEWPGDELPKLRVWQPRLKNAPIILQPELVNGVATLKMPRLIPDQRPGADY